MYIHIDIATGVCEQQPLSIYTFKEDSIYPNVVHVQSSAYMCVRVCACMCACVHACVCACARMRKDREDTKCDRHGKKAMPFHCSFQTPQAHTTRKSTPKGSQKEKLKGVTSTAMTCVTVFIKCTHFTVHLTCNIMHFVIMVIFFQRNLNRLLLWTVIRKEPVLKVVHE